MSIQPKTKGLAHVALRTTDFARAKAFYHDLLGLPIALETPEILGAISQLETPRLRGVARGAND